MGFYLGILQPQKSQLPIPEIGIFHWRLQIPDLHPRGCKSPGIFWSSPEWTIPSPWDGDKGSPENPIPKSTLYKEYKAVKIFVSVTLLELGAFFYNLRKWRKTILSSIYFELWIRNSSLFLNLHSFCFKIFTSVGERAWSFRAKILKRTLEITTWSSVHKARLNPFNTRTTKSQFFHWEN